MEKIQMKFNSLSDAYAFVNRLSEESKDEFVFTTLDESKVVYPKTQIGIVYALADFDDIYLVNKTHDGVFPEFIK